MGAIAVETGVSVGAAVSTPAFLKPVPESADVPEKPGPEKPGLLAPEELGACTERRLGDCDAVLEYLESPRGGQSGARWDGFPHEKHDRSGVSGKPSRYE